MGNILSLILILLLLSTEIQAKNYYLSNEGNNRSKGTSPQEAWQTLSRLQKAKLSPGDTVFFKRGDLFFGGIEINRSGKEGKPIVFTAYGKGEKPVLTGAKLLTDWQEKGQKIYTTQFSEKVYDLYINGAWQTPARFPNTGFILADNGEGKNILISDLLTQTDGHWDGATLRMRTADWAFESRKVTDHAKGKLTIGKQDRYGIERGFLNRSDNGNTMVYPIKEGYGFYLESPKALDTLGEWSQVNGEVSIVLPAEKSPNELKVMATVHGVAIQIYENVKHVTISNLAFQQYEQGAIRGSHHLRNIEISNNLISNIHQIGVRLDSASVGCKIINNNIYDILGRGIDANEPVNLEIKDNQIRKIGMKEAQGWTGVNGGIAILISNIERKSLIDTTFAHHNTVSGNRVDSCGYAGVRVDGHHNLVEYNLIQNIGFTLNDGAALYCFAQVNDVTHHSIFRKNILRNGFGNVKGAVKEKDLLIGIYMDNHSSHIQIKDNVVIDFNSHGIMVNDASYNNTVKNNLIIDCASGISFLEWRQLGRNFGNEVIGNTVISKTPDQNGVFISNTIGTHLKPGVLNRNTYINLESTDYFKHRTRQIPDINILKLTFENWKKVTGEDTNSKAITAATEWAKGYEPVLHLNETLENKTIQVTQGALTLEGETAPKSITLEPFTSEVLLQKK